MVKEFRPIARCTTLYNIIAKIITSRLQHVIGEVVSESQVGFIHRRQLGDNIILATELIKGYTRKHMSPTCMRKVDLRKAYYSLEWPFLRSMLLALGFPIQFCVLGDGKCFIYVIYNTTKWPSNETFSCQKKALGKETLCLLFYLHCL